MKMKASTFAFLTLCSILCFSSIRKSSAHSVEDFIHCLSGHTANSSIPISKAIYTPNNPQFTNVLHAYARNRRFSTSITPKPRYIVTALHYSHVQATVLCAKKNKLQVRIRSGGHDYEGLSYVSQVPFVLLDLFNLNKVHVNLKKEIADVQAGATIGELYYKIAKKSKVHAFPAGIGISLGTGGHFSGGGYGALTRKYGLSVDNIIDAELVDAKGEILNRKAMGEYVFWAIRGGGGQSFGVILSWKIKLVRVPETLTVFSVTKKWEQGATDAAYKWQLVAPKLPKEVFIRAQPRVVGDTLEVSFIGQFLGNAEALLPILNKRFPELGLKESDCIPMSWANSTLFWVNLPQGAPLEALLARPTGGTFFKMKSDYVKKPFTKDTLESIWKEMNETKSLFMQWDPYGGRISEIPVNETPFPHREGNLFLIQYLNHWSDEKDTDIHIDASRDFYDFMTPFVSSKPREAYLNYRDIDIGSKPTNAIDIEDASVYGSKYFKDNFNRLTLLKGYIDPENFFQNEQSIPPFFPDDN